MIFNILRNPKHRDRKLSAYRGRPEHPLWTKKELLRVSECFQISSVTLLLFGLGILSMALPHLTSTCDLAAPSVPMTTWVYSEGHSSLVLYE